MNPFDKDPLRDYTSARRPPVPLIVGLVAAVVIGLGVAVLAFGSGGGSDSQPNTDAPRLANSTGPDVAATQPPEAPTPEPTPPPPPPTPEPPPEPTVVPQLTTLGSGDRLSIPRFGINAPLTYKSVGAGGQMPDPDGSDDVAYYNFSKFPGLGGATGKGGNSVPENLRLLCRAHNRFAAERAYGRDHVERAIRVRQRNAKRRAASGQPPPSAPAPA